MSSQMRFSLRSGGEFGDAMSAFSFDYVENVTLAGYRFLVRFYFRRRQTHSTRRAASRVLSSRSG